MPTPATPDCSSSSSGDQFSDQAAANGGIFKALLNGGAAGKSKILIKGKGPEVPSPPAPFGDLTTLTVQLFKSDGTTCWQADFPAGSIKASDTSLKAKSP